MTRSKPRKQRVQNDVGRRDLGAGTVHDHGAGLTPTIGGPLFSTMAQDAVFVDLFYRDWAATKIVTIPVEDSLREGWTYDGFTDEARRDPLMKEDDRLKVLKVFKQAGIMERLLGGSAIFIGVSDGQQKPSLPIDFARIPQGGLKFLNVIPRTRVSHVTYQQNPLTENYGRPETYWINGQEVHRSRLIIFDGDPLLPVYDSVAMRGNFQRADGFGTSVLLPIYEDLVRATGSRQAAMQLIQRASVILAQMDIGALKGTTTGERQVQAMKDIVNMIDVYRGAVIDKQPGDQNPTVTTMAASFGSVPELLMSFLQVLSAASDIPAARFLGQAPGGLNATGESDLENYYGRIASAQRQKLRPQLMQYLEVAGRSVYGPLFDSLKLDVTFPALWSLSEVEAAQIRTSDTANIVSLVTNNIIDETTAINELNQREVFVTAVSAEDIPEVTDANAAAPGANLAAAMAALSGTPTPPTDEASDDVDPPSVVGA